MTRISQTRWNGLPRVRRPQQPEYDCRDLGVLPILFAGRTRLATIDERTSLTVIRMHPYKPRQIEPLAPLSIGDWRLKRYSVCHEDHDFDETRFATGVESAIKALPQPARTAERAGVGFIILHQGNGIDYTVLGWWDRENELPMRVFVCDHPGSNTWRPAAGSESICVWDLQVIWAEREAYVSTVLSGAVPDTDAYLNRSARV